MQIWTARTIRMAARPVNGDTGEDSALLLRLLATATPILKIGLKLKSDYCEFAAAALGRQPLERQGSRNFHNKFVH